jgi:CRP/FNR family transcriptional regulator, dissimilatory nitrate respiration regulator
VPNDAEMLADLPAPLRSQMTQITLAPGQHVFFRGDKPTSIFVILSGEVQLVRTSAQGRDVIFQRTKQGFLAEASLDQEAYHCDAIAAVASTAVSIPRQVFLQALAGEQFSQWWLSHLYRELRCTRAHVERLSLPTVVDRIIHYIETEGVHGRLILRQTRKEWASELGLSHEALYRTLRKMREGGLIEVSGNNIMLPARP